MSRHSPCACALDVPSGPSRDIGGAAPAGYLFHDPEDVYNPPRVDRPPPPIWRQLLTDVAWTVVVLGAVIVGIIVSDLS